MGEKNEISLPKFQLLVLFFGCTFFFLPIVTHANLLGSITLGMFIFFYLLSELSWLHIQFALSNKDLAIYITITLGSGLSAFEVFFLLGLCAVCPISKFIRV